MRYFFSVITLFALHTLMPSDSYGDDARVITTKHTDAVMIYNAKKRSARPEMLLRQAPSEKITAAPYLKITITRIAQKEDDYGEDDDGAAMEISAEPDAINPQKANVHVFDK